MKQTVKEHPWLLAVILLSVAIFVALPAVTMRLSNLRERSVSRSHELRKEVSDIMDAVRAYVFEARTSAVLANSNHNVDRARERIYSEIENVETLATAEGDAVQVGLCRALKTYLDQEMAQLSVKRDQGEDLGRFAARTVPETAAFISHVETFTTKMDGIESAHLAERQLSANHLMLAMNITSALASFSLIIFFVLIISRSKQDMRALMKLDEDLRLSQQRAEAANQAKSTFLANMSHEVRTPLSAILGFADFLDSEALTDDERTNYIAGIKRNGRSLLQVVNDLLDVSKVEAGKLATESLPFDLRQVVDDVMDTLSFKAKEKGLAFKVEWLDRIPKRITADEARLRQVLLNVVGNAIKFTSDGEVVVSSRWRPGFGEGVGDLLIAVRDTGLGISAEQQTRLFKPFGQADASTSRRYGGTGLGLLLSRQLCQLMGGNLRLVESTPGRGSTFEIMISAPTCTDEMTERQQTQAAKSHRLDGARILLAEDAPDNQLLICRYLKEAGASVEVASNGRVAIDKCSTEPFDVVLMDVQMPEIDGYEATTTLRNAGYVVPILALSAHAMREDRRRSLELGCNEHITKPIDKVEFLATVEKYYKQSRAERLDTLH